MLSRKIFFGSIMTMALSILFGAIGNQPLMLVLTAFSGAELALALYLSGGREDINAASKQEILIYGVLILGGVIITGFFDFPAGLPLFVPAAVAILREKTNQKEISTP